MGRAREAAVFERGSYTPAWTGSGFGDPVLGNGSIAGRYMRHGKTVTVTISLAVGSTTTFGAGYWSFSLPFPVDAAISHIGTAQIADSSVPTVFTGNVINLTSTTIVVYSHNTAAPAGGSVPMSWGNLDTLRLTFTYEAA
jgi:hypothetical protein